MTHLLGCHPILKTDFVRGEGCYLYDTNGDRFVDYESGTWSAVLGHGHPRVTEAIRQQVAQLIHLGTAYPSPLAEDLAVSLLRLSGVDEGKCTFLSSGSEAVEFGAQVARTVTARPLLLTLAGSYLAAYGSAGHQRPGEWHVYDWRSPDRVNSVKTLESIPFDQIGAFVFEPGGSSSTYVHFPATTLVEELANHVKASGGLLVANEVTTGFGRTGKWFGYQHYAIQPDIIAIGKGLGNGYPISAIVLSAEVAERYEAHAPRYAQSHQNDPLGCAVGLAVVNTLRDEDWIDRGNATGAKLMRAIQRTQRKSALVKDVRGRGMLIGIELHAESGFSVKTVHESLLTKRCLVGCSPAGNLLRLDPALVLSEPQIDYLVEQFTEVVGRGAG